VTKRYKFEFNYLLLHSVERANYGWSHSTPYKCKNLYFIWGWVLL